jgi:hypothetical protein
MGLGRVKTMIFWPILTGVRFHTARGQKSPSNCLELMSAFAADSGN